MDAETFLIAPGLLAPKPVCISVAETIDEAKLFVGADMLPWLEEHLPENTFVGHNFIYDMVVFCAEWPHLLPLVFDAYESGRVRCTQLRQQLLDIRDGCFRFKTEDDGTQTPQGYGLKDLVWRHFKRHVDKGEDTWRLRYSELDGVPLKFWPKAAVDYALNDATATLEVWKKLSPEMLPDEPLQNMGHFALQLCSVWGIRTEKEAVDKLKSVLQSEADALMDRLKSLRVFDKHGKKSVKRLQQLVEEAYTKKGEEPPHTEKGAVRTDADTLERSGDKLLVELGGEGGVFKLLQAFVPKLENGVDKPLLSGYSLVVSGRTSAKSPFRDKGAKHHGFNIQQMPRKSGVRPCFVPREGFCYSSVDWSMAELRALAQMLFWLFGESEMLNALKRGEDLHLSLAASSLGITYEEAQRRKREPEIADARQFSKCFHPDTEILTKRGWVKVSELSMRDQVAAAQPEKNSVKIFWETPQRLTWRHADKLVHLQNAAGIDLKVTEDHRMLGWNMAKNPVWCTPRELSKKRFWAGAGAGPEEGIEIEEKLLRLAVAVQADGTYGRTRETDFYNTEGFVGRSGTSQVRLGFSKKRKIERLRSLLLEGDYTESVTSNGRSNKTTHFCLSEALGVKIQSLLENKMLPWWWLSLSRRCREVVLEEARFWDGSQGKRNRAYYYFSAPKQNIDVLQAIATLTEKKSNLSRSDGRVWRLAVKDHWHTRGENVRAEDVEWNDKVYCLTVSSGAVVARGGGIPVVVGQCANFGYPGGLSSKSFVDYSRQQYGIEISEEKSEWLRNGWFKRWPEMREYFSWVKRTVGMDVGPMKCFVSGRVRGACGFTDGANNGFQALVADMGKETFFQLQRECYVDKSSPLFGSRAVAWLHDESLLEIPLDVKHDAAMRQAEIHRQKMQKYLPDVPAVAEPALMPRWYKDAETVYGEDGKLALWVPTLA